MSITNILREYEKALEEVSKLEKRMIEVGLPFVDDKIAPLVQRLNKQEQELNALRGFANYILRETDFTIKEHGYKPLEQIDPDNTKIDIHVFVSELQKAKQTVRQSHEEQAS